MNHTITISSLGHMIAGHERRLRKVEQAIGSLNAAIADLDEAEMGTWRVVQEVDYAKRHAARILDETEAMRRWYWYASEAVEKSAVDWLVSMHETRGYVAAPEALVSMLPFVGDARECAFDELIPAEYYLLVDVLPYLGTAEEEARVTQALKKARIAA